MKMIAVIDEPESCATCPCCEIGYAFDMCKLSRRSLSSYDSINIPKWCELRQLPPRKQAKVSVENGVHITGLLEFGWNECLDAIVGNGDEDVIDY